MSKTNMGGGKMLVFNKFRIWLRLCFFILIMFGLLNWYFEDNEIF